MIAIARRGLSFVLLVALGALGLAQAADPDLKVPQTVTVYWKNGTTTTGILVRATVRDVQLRTRPGKAALRFETSTIDSIHARDGVYRFSAAALSWRLALDEEKKVRKAPAVPPRDKDKPAPVASVQTVEAEGVGSTAEEARKDAIREAVRKVAGALVLGETTVENDKVIKDKVLTYSDGVIAPDGYREVDRKKEGDGWRIKVSAIVVSRKLADRLMAAGLRVREVDGEGLAAAVLSRSEARLRANELLRTVLADLPKTLAAEARKPTPRDYDEDSQALRLDVRVAADAKAYQAFLERLVVVLDKVSVGQDRFDFTADPPRVRPASTRRPRDDESKAIVVAHAFRGKNDRMFLSLKVADDDSKGWYLWVLASSSADWRGTRWLAYLLDCNREEVLKTLALTPYLVVSLVDGDGKLVKKTELALQAIPGARRGGDDGSRWLLRTNRAAATSAGVGRGGKEAPNAAIAPVIHSTTTSGLNYAPLQDVRCEVSLTEADLRRVKDVRCEVHFR